MSWNQQQESEKREYEEAFGRAPAVDGRMERRSKVAIIAKDTGGGDFKQVPAGTHLARCFRIIDLGTQPVVWQGETKHMLKLMITWELFGEDDDLSTDDGMPLIISKRYTNSLGKKANLRADLEKWRGVPFTEVELRGFDVEKLLDKWCLLSVLQTSKDGKTYSNVASVSSLPKAMKATLPKGVHELVSFSVLDPDMDVYEKFHDKLKETIKGSLEMMAKAEWKDDDDTANKELATAGKGFDDIDDDIPF